MGRHWLPPSIANLQHSKCWGEMLNKTICCLSVLIYFICSARHINTYKKCSRRKLFWTKYFKFTAAFSDSHHRHSTRIYSVRVFICGAKLTQPLWSGMLDINPSSLIRCENWPLYKSQVSVGFFSSHFLIEIKYQSWIKLTARGVIEGKDQTKTKTSYLSLSVPPFLHFYHISNLTIITL